MSSYIKSSIFEGMCLLSAYRQNSVTAHNGIRGNTNGLTVGGWMKKEEL